MEQQGEIVLYQPETTFKLEVRLENETVWLTQAQIAELFGTGRQAITKHLKNIFNSNELEENSVCSILELTAADGKTYKTKISSNPQLSSSASFLRLNVLSSLN